MGVLAGVEVEIEVGDKATAGTGAVGVSTRSSSATSSNDREAPAIGFKKANVNDTHATSAKTIQTSMTRINLPELNSGTRDLSPQAFEAKRTIASSEHPSKKTAMLPE